MTLWEQVKDALRRPKQTPALAQTQTDVKPGAGGGRAQIGWLPREFAEHPSKGLTPAKLYAILSEAESGHLKAQHDLFADMEEKDAQIAADMGKRKLSLAGLEWQIAPPDQPNRIEKKAAAQADEVFRSLEVEDLLIDLADGIGHGWVNLEIPWTRDGLTRAFSQPVWRPHGWFQIDTQTDQNILRLRDGSGAGEELWPLGWVRHIHKAKSGYITRLGLYRSIVWPYLFKNYALGDLAELLDILGIPARLGTYPRGASEAEKATLLSAVAQLGRKAAGIIPEGMAIEYLEAARATGEPYTIMLDWCERVMSKAVLGGTLTTGTEQGSGAYALGRVHERGLQELVASDARQISASITRDLVWPLAALNYGIQDRTRSPRFVLDTSEAEDSEMLSKSRPVFVSLGARIPRWWLHEKTGIPEAAESEEILEASAPVTPEPAADDPEAEPKDDAPLTAKLATTRDEPDAVDAMVDQLGRDASPLVDAMLAAVRRELVAAPSLEAARDRLEALYPELNRTNLSDLFASAFVAAELSGMDEARR